MGDLTAEAVNLELSSNPETRAKQLEKLLRRQAPEVREYMHAYFDIWPLKKDPPRKYGLDCLDEMD